MRDSRRRSRHGVHSPACQGCHAREPLQEIERHPLAREHGPASRSQRGERRPGHGPVAFGGVGLEARPWVELVEDQLGDRQAGDHEAIFGDEAGSGRGVRGGTEQSGRHVLICAVLGQRPAHLLQAQRVSQ